MAQSIIPVEGVAYTANAFDDIFEALGVQGAAVTQGVFRTAPGVNVLAVTGTATPVAVASGWALVKGKLYKNTSSENITVGSPATYPRIDRVVLRINFTATPVTCLLALLAGTEAASPTPPALTQTDGTTWEISLAQVRITTAGVITVTDERAYVGDGQVATASIAADAVTNAKIVDDAIDSEHYVDLSIDTAHIGNLQVTEGKIAANAVANAKLRQSVALSLIGRSANSTGDVADIVAANDAEVLRRSGTTVGFGTVATAGIANDAVDDTKAGNRVLRLDRRQGSSAVDWGSFGVSGTTSYTPTGVRMQAGAARWTEEAAASGGVTVTFPVAFGNQPIVVANSLESMIPVGVYSFAGNGATVDLLWRTIDGSTRVAVEIYWIAVGPE